jgi:hypothetical protein
MTAARVVDEDREKNPDWVICARIMWGQDPLCEPSEAEIRAAVWILLDRGRNIVQIKRDTVLTDQQVDRTVELRRLARQPDTGPRPCGGMTPKLARKLAPSPQLRWVLTGVGKVGGSSLAPYLAEPAAVMLLAGALLAPVG